MARNKANPATQTVEKIKQKKNMIASEFKFFGTLFMYTGNAAWHFVTLPEEDAAQIKFLQTNRTGFGSVRVKAKIGNTEWKTSIFPDKKSNSYLLPIKSEVRKKEKIKAGDEVNVNISVDF